MGNVYSHKVKQLALKVLPKVVDRFNEENNFELPYIEITSIDGWPSNLFKAAMHGDEPIFNSLRVNVFIEEKDGRLGKVKKLITKLIEQVLSSLNYGADEIYINFQTEK